MNAEETRPSVLDQMGGIWGLVYSTIPTLVFVTANAFLSLTVTIVVSVAVGLAITGLRLLRGERFSLAVGGLFGLALAVGIVALTGSARDFFLVGIWVAAVSAAVTLLSVLVRRPLTGVIWNAVHGGTHAWRADRPTLLAHDLATLAATAVFAARFVVTQWLYAEDSTGWLAFAKIAMGTPLTVVTAVAVIWAFRRSSKRLTPGSARPE